MDSVWDNKGERIKADTKMLNCLKVPDFMEEGEGYYKWLNEVKYEGQFKDYKKHGKGIETLPDGTRYDGDWENHLKHGKGNLTLPDGTSYVG